MEVQLRSQWVDTRIFCLFTWPNVFWMANTDIPAFFITFILKQESIPVGCSPPTFLIRGGRVSAGRPPLTEIPPQGTWDQAARQEVASYIIPLLPWTEWQTGVKTLTCPKLRLRAVIIFKSKTFQLQKTCKAGNTSREESTLKLPVWLWTYWSKLLNLQVFLLAGVLSNILFLKIAWPLCQ